jgi:hypothetical protein
MSLAVLYACGVLLDCPKIRVDELDEAIEVFRRDLSIVKFGHSDNGAHIIRSLTDSFCCSK